MAPLAPLAAAILPGVTSAATITGAGTAASSLVATSAFGSSILSGLSTIGAALPTVATGASVAGTGLNVIGALQAGEAAKEQADFEFQLAQSQAIQEQLRTEEEARLRRRRGEELESRQRALFARAGVRVGEGTPLLVAAETALDTLEDIEAIQAGGRARASTFMARGQTFRAIGKAKRTESRYRAGASLLSGISDLIT